MKYKPKSVAALHIALGGLPDKMRVQTDRDIGVSAKTVGQLREGKGVARKLGHSSPTGAPSRKRGNGEQGDRRNSIPAEVVARIPAAEHNKGSSAALPGSRLQHLIGMKACIFAQHAIREHGDRHCRVGQH
jgi:hypothetical protein